MKKWVLRIILVVIAVVLLVGTLSACGDEWTGFVEVENLQEFVSALNDTEVNKIKVKSGVYGDEANFENLINSKSNSPEKGRPHWATRKEWNFNMKFVNEKLEEFNKFLDGKKVAIIGMGVSNVPLLDYFYDKNAKVTVFDKRNLSDEIMEKINRYRYEVEIGEDNLSRLHGFDVIFRSPSALPTTPEFVEEVEKGALLTSEIEMVLKLAPCKVIGITGTEGKTTTTSIIYEILKQAGYNCFLGGNIGKPIFTKVKDMRPDDIIVLELSSFQLMGMDVSPDISVVTNMFPDHLNVHKSYEEYQEAKKNIFLHQDKNGIIVSTHFILWAM